MAENSGSLPAGAGATTHGRDMAAGTRAGASAADRSVGSSRGDLVLVEERSGPSTATVIGAAIAGAVVGGAIPFMLGGRSSSRSTGSGSAQQDSVVNESVIVNRSPREIYDFWRNFENLPQFMDNIKSVEKRDETHSHWVIKAPAGTSVEFDSRVTEDVPGRSIGWQSEDDASVPNRGRVEFIETASGNATNVRVTMSYDPPAGAAGRAIAKLFQREPSVQAREDLNRLKQLLEGGR